MAGGEKSCGAVIYRIDGGKRLYLLLKYGKGYWDLPKGHVESGEGEEQTARREIFEETGISELEFQPLFRHPVSYWFMRGGEKIPKAVIFFLAKTSQKEVALSDEHVGFLWLPYNLAFGKMSYKNAKDVLEKAEGFLSSKP